MLISRRYLRIDDIKYIFTMCCFAWSTTASSILFPGACLPRSSMCGDPLSFTCAFSAQSNRPFEMAYVCAQKQRLTHSNWNTFIVEVEYSAVFTAGGTWSCCIPLFQLNHLHQSTEVEVLSIGSRQSPRSHHKASFSALHWHYHHISEHTSECHQTLLQQPMSSRIVEY